MITRRQLPTDAEATQGVFAAVSSAAYT